MAYITVRGGRRVVARQSATAGWDDVGRGILDTGKGIVDHLTGRTEQKIAEANAVAAQANASKPDYTVPAIIVGVSLLGVTLVATRRR